MRFFQNWKNHKITLHGLHLRVDTRQKYVLLNRVPDIKIKNQLFLSGDSIKYKHYWNMLCKLTCLRKKEYYFYYFNENFTYVRKTWEGVSSLLNRKKNKNKTINTLKNFGSNTTINNKSIISNVLNKHFTSIGTKLAAKLPNSEKHFTQFLS